MELPNSPLAPLRLGARKFLCPEACSANADGELEVV